MAKSAKKNSEKKNFNKKYSTQRSRNNSTSGRWVWGGIGFLVVLAVSLLVYNGAQPVLGQSVPVPANAETHIPETTRPGPYTSNPPAGGVHFAGTFPAGFYDEEELSTLPPYPEGYLVHTQEHGYVILWYNCGLVDESTCNDIKNGIKSVMAEFNNSEVIGFPWTSMDVPVALSSWGKILKMDKWSDRDASQFIRENLNNSPEAATQ